MVKGHNQDNDRLTVQGGNGQICIDIGEQICIEFGEQNCIFEGTPL
jgi:hypothetical protein